jgi:HK97 gp10 family phage protein
MEFSITPTNETKILIKMFGNASEIVKNAKVKGLTQASLIFQAKAQDEAPVDTTNLRRNIKYKVESDGSEATIFVDDKIKYAIFQEEGTRAHGPVRAKMLAWKSKSGQLIFAKWVRGVKARWFMRKGKEEVEAQSNKISQTIYNELKKGLYNE